MAFMNYLAQLQQPRAPIGPDPEMGRMNMLAAALEKGQQWEAAQAEKARLLAKEEAAAKLAADERAHKQATERLTMLQTLGGNARDAGDQQAVGELYNQSVPLLDQAYGIKANPLVGGMRALTNQEAAAQPGNVADLFSYDAQGNFRPALQDFRNEQSQDRAAQLFGPGKDTTLAPGNSVARNGEIIVTAPYAPKVIANGRYGNSVIDMNGGGGGGQMMPPIAGTSQPASAPRMAVPPSAPAARGGGGGRRSSGGGRGRSGGITWDAPDANGYQTGSNGQVRRVPGFSANTPKPSGLTGEQVTNAAIARVKALPSYRDMDDDQFNAAVAKTEQTIRAAQPKPQPQRQSGPKPGAKKGLAASLIQRLEKL